MVFNGFSSNLGVVFGPSLFGVYAGIIKPKSSCRMPLTKIARARRVVCCLKWFIACVAVLPEAGL